MEFINEKAQDLTTKTEEMMKESSSENHKKIIIHQIWETFCLKTNAHGFFKITEDTKTMRIVWIFIMGITLTGFFSLIIFLLQQLFAYNLNAEVEISSLSEFSMPDITICPRQRYFFYDTRTLPFIPSFTPSNVTLSNNVSFYQYFNQSKLIWQRLGFNSDATMLARYSILQESQKANLFRNQHNILVVLNFKNINISSDEFQLLFRPDGIRCVIYRPKDRIIKSSDETADLYMIPSIPTVGNDDIYESMIQTSSELEKLRLGSSLFIHPPLTMPEFDTQELIIPRDYIAQLAIERNENNLNNINNRCKDTQDPIRIYQNGIITEYSYTQSMCFNLRNQIFIYNKCNCISETLFWPIEIPINVQSCHEIPTLFIQQLPLNSSMYSIYQQNYFLTIQNNHLCHDNFMLQFNSSNEINNCPIPCNSVRFTYDKSMVFIKDTIGQFKSLILELLPKLKSKLIRLGLPTGQFDRLNSSDLSLQMCFITIIPKSFNIIIIRENLVYQIGNFFSDVGGTMGLFVGFTIITIFDLCELMIFIFAFLFSVYRRKKSVDSPTDIK